MTVILFLVHIAPAGVINSINTCTAFASVGINPLSATIINVRIYSTLLNRTKPNCYSVLTFYLQKKTDKMYIL